MPLLLRCQSFLQLLNQMQEKKKGGGVNDQIVFSSPIPFILHSPARLQSQPCHSFLALN